MQRADGTPHTWDDSQLAWDNGRMANWPTHKTDISMGYFKEKEIISVCTCQCLYDL